MRWLEKKRAQKRISSTLATFAKEREMIKKAMEEQAVAKSAPLQEESHVKEPLHVTYRRVELPDVEMMYDRINISNYKEMADRIGHMEREVEFVLCMCIIDKCEEYGDYDTMVSTFKVFEYVIRHKKESTPTLSYVRKYAIQMRVYLTDLGLL